MKYYQINLQIQPMTEDFADLLAQDLAAIGFETFTPTEDGIIAYIQQSQLDEEALEEVIHNFLIPNVLISYTKTDAPDEDWNRVWEEEGFQPVIVNEDIVVHDVKHTEVPDVHYDILITPRQAFGTGSHETTRMLLRELYEMDLKNCNVIDAGTGTGVLAIMCIKRGAKNVVAYDIDEWSTENTRDNLLLNGIHNEVEIRLGDCRTIENEREKDLVIANINRNILLEDMPTFASTLKTGGMLLLSGFYEEDVHCLAEKANSLGFSLEKQVSDGQWTMLKFYFTGSMTSV